MKTKYQTIKEIVNQILSSDYECEGGCLKMNVAFQRLEEISKLNYQPKFHLNEKVVFNKEQYFIRGMITAECSHPNPEIEYILSKEWNHESTTNKTDVTWVNERLIHSMEEWEKIDIEDAIKRLKERGVLIDGKLKIN